MAGMENFDRPSDNPTTNQVSANSSAAAPQQINPPAQPNAPAGLDQDGSSSDRESKASGFFRVVKFILSWIVTPLALVFLFQTLIFQAFYVNGQSMEPSFNNGDYLIITKLGLTLNNAAKLLHLKPALAFHRGDILIFKPPIATSEFFIKRVIALPGERVMIKNGQVTIYNSQHPDGFVIHEPYTDQASKAPATLGNIDEVIDQDKYFVMGDNRLPDASYDSRQWGELPASDISGKVVSRLLPLNNFELVPSPQY